MREMSDTQMREVIQNIIDILYFDDVNRVYDINKSWNSNTVSEIATMLEEYGLTPKPE